MEYETMAAFFDARADGYDAHMLAGKNSYTRLRGCLWQDIKECGAIVRARKEG